MLAGTWILVLLPLMDVLRTSGLASRMPIPTMFDFRSTVRTLDDTLVTFSGVYTPLIFCMGVVLLFSKERRQHRVWLNWTRRWGVICSYVVLLLSAAQVFLIAALVLVGIAAVFLSMPPKYQPGVTHFFVQVGSGYLRYGAYPKDLSVGVLVAFSSIAILLACVQLFEALRRVGTKHVAASLLAPLALFSLIHLAQAGWFCLGLAGLTSTEAYRYAVYFWPQLLVTHVSDLLRGLNVSALSGEFIMELAKWCIVLSIAVWLSIAQFGAWRHGKKTSTA